MQRRAFLQRLSGATLAGWATSVSGSLFAAPATTPRLLLVFLRGGYDASNLLVPISSADYYAARPNIAIAAPASAYGSASSSALNPNAAIALNADWGLHPALHNNIHPLFAAGQAAFVPFAGTDETSRSHFQTQDSIEMGQAPGGTRAFRSGFLNRLVSTLNGTNGISLTEQLPLIFQGPVPIPNIAVQKSGNGGIDPRQAAIIASMYENTALAPQVNEGIALREDMRSRFAAEMQAASRNAISAKGFALQSRRIAQLMKDKYRIGFVDVGGWDTHVAQGNANGYLAGRFDELGSGLAAFAEEMGTEWRSTVTVVISEFGRTFRENGNRGTDHGHGTVFWILGGGINGGKIAGEQIALSAATLFQQRDLPVLNEYRAVLGGLFARQFGLRAAQISEIFPGATARDLGLI